MSHDDVINTKDNADILKNEQLDIPARRKFLRDSILLAGAAGAAGLFGGLSTGAWAAGSDAPEKTEVKVGFIPLTDCASIVVAAEMGFDKKYGIKIVPS